jgi:DNA polymerase
VNERLEDIRAAVAQLLDTELLLGVREIPMAPVAAREASPAPAAPRTHQLTTRVQTTATVASAADDDRAVRLRLLDESQVQGCTKCTLHRGRTQTVFGQGNAGARLVFVGEAPGFEEDRTGQAFVGRAGQLLTRMIEAMGLTRDEVFICNVLKCRPPNNRDPAADEISACSPYLFEQLSIIQPEVIIALGSPAAKTLLNTGESIGRLRGRFHDFYISGLPGVGAAVPLMPTYHPAYLLRSPADKGKAWDDLQKVMAKLGLPTRTRS